MEAEGYPPPWSFRCKSAQIDDFAWLSKRDGARECGKRAKKGNDATAN